MSEPRAVLAFLAAAFVAAVCAVADGALLAIAPDEAARDPRLRALHQNRERLHRTLAFVRIASHLAAGAAAAIALDLADRTVRSAVLQGAAVTLVMVAICESGARAFGDAVGAPAILRLATLVRALSVAVAPVVVPVGRLEALLGRLMPPPAPDAGSREAIAEQFREVVAAEADVSRREERLIEGVFSLGRTSVADVMVPRVDMVGIDRDTPWSELLDRIRASEHARIPVFDQSLDNILGVLNTKDLLPAVLAESEPDTGWAALVRPAAFIPTSKLIGDQLREFQRSGNHLAIVVDEYGGTAGLVTIEDVLEEIVGEIRDEHDAEEPRELEREGERWWASGRVTLDDLSDAVGHDFRREDISTVGGLILEELGRVPEPGEALTLDGFRVVVERVRRHRVERVYFERPRPVPTARHRTPA
jgi:putative hemolysin